MAIYNEILAGRFNKSLQKLFSIKGHAPVRQVSGEIMPVHELHRGRETRYLEGWNFYWAAVAGIVGAAGNSPVFRLTNDIASNVIAVIEKLVIGTAAATLVDIQFSNQATLVSGHVPNLGTILPTFAQDGRVGATSLSTQSTLVASTSTTTNTSGQLIHKRQTQAGIDVDVLLGLADGGELVMVPQSLLNIFAEAAASTLFLSIVWRERYLEESERI